MDRVVALDGLRVVAIAAVVAYHVDKEIFPAGFWGVTLFFVLSGYLVTRQLVADVDVHGSVRFARFWARRAARMYLAMVVLVGAVWVAGKATAGAVLASITLTANYARIGGVNLGILTHLWFLAVIAHFYLVWPLVISAIAPERRRQVLGGLLLVAVAWRAISIVTLSPGWVYNATDTNMVSLFAGAYLAVAKPVSVRALPFVLPAMVTLMFLPVFGEQGSGFFWGLYLPVGLSALAILYAQNRPAWLEVRPMQLLGTISYGIYLWHYVFLRGGLLIGLVLPATIAASVASWYLLEKPMREWVVRREHPKIALS